MKWKQHHIKNHDTEHHIVVQTPISFPAEGTEARQGKNCRTTRKGEGVHFHSHLCFAGVVGLDPEASLNIDLLEAYEALSSLKCLIRPLSTGILYSRFSKRLWKYNLPNSSNIFLTRAKRLYKNGDIWFVFALRQMDLRRCPVLLRVPSSVHLVISGTSPWVPQISAAHSPGYILTSVKAS